MRAQLEMTLLAIINVPGLIPETFSRQLCKCKRDCFAHVLKVCRLEHT